MSFNPNQQALPVAKQVSIVPSFVTNAPNAPVLPSGPSIVNLGQPNRTIYIQNLNEKAPLGMLKWDLMHRFEDYGKVLQIVAKKNIRMRGQAFLLFDTVENARKALESQQGRPLYGKPMVIRFAKFRSDAVTKADGTYEAEHRRIDEYRKQQMEQQNVNLKSNAARNLLKQSGGQHANPQFIPQNASSASAVGKPAGAATVASIPVENAPNKTLFVQNIPTAAASVVGWLTSLFGRMGGFVDVRLVPGRPDLAFVDYETEMQAAAAKNALSSRPHPIGGGENGQEAVLTIAFAKK